MYIFMCILNRSALRQLNGSRIAKASPRMSQRGEASTSPKRTITKPVALCAHGGYKASFEACLVDLGGLEKHNFQQRCWKTAESVTAWRGFPSILTRLLHSGPFSDWLLSSHCSVELFQARVQTRNSCSYYKTDCYYR